MRNCSVRVIGLRTVPFVIDMGEDRVDGLEIKLLQSIAQHMNFTPKFKYVKRLIIEQSRLQNNYVDF